MLKKIFKIFYVKNRDYCYLLITGALLGILPCFAGQWALVIIMGIILILITLFNTKLGIFALVFLQLGLTQSTIGLTKTEIIFLIFFCSVIIGWILHKLLSKKKQTIYISSLGTPILSLLTICIFSFVPSIYNHINIINWFSEWRVFLVLILFFIILNEFKSKKELKWLVYIFLFTTTLICIKDLMLAANHGGLKKMWEIAGVEYASLFFIMAIPFSVTIFITTKKYWIKLLQIILILLFVFRISISLMRSYVLALLVISTIFITLLLILKIIKNKKVFFQIIILITILFLLAGTAFFIFRVQINEIVKNNITRFSALKNFRSIENASALTRIVEAKAAWNYVRNQPILGHGFGFKYQYYRPNGVLYEIPYVHLVPLFFFLKIGVIGIIVITWLIIRVLLLNWRILKRESNLFWKLLELAIFSNFIGILVLSLFVTNTIRIDSIFYLTITMGMIAVLKKIEQPSTSY